MSAQIAIVGAGALGSRHVQALARVDRTLSVDLIDPTAPARAQARNLLDQAGGLKGGVVRDHDDFHTLKETPDLAIVATNSRERGALVADLLDAGVRRFILEKVLFTRIADYDRIGALVARSGAKVWVNCVRRTYGRFAELLQFVRGAPFDYRVEGAGWGLGCNVIHHLDEYDMLSGSAPLTLSAAGLEPDVVPAKRAGYVEFLGALEGTSSAGRFSAICTDGTPGDRLVTIEAGARTVVISQKAQTMTVAENGATRVERYPIPLQSESTADHVAAILEDRAPALPDYATAARLHRSMIAVFLDHMRRVRNDPTIEECPIT
jgi:predicted dehydrogenase